MKKIKFYLASCLLITSLTSCEEDGDFPIIEMEDNGITVTDVTLSSQNAFVGDKIDLNFNTEGQDSLKVLTSENNLDITELTETSYEITSSGIASGFIDMTFYRDTIVELQQVLVNFHEHGVVGKVVEGIEIDSDKRSSLELLLGKPEGKYLISEIVKAGEVDEDAEDPEAEVLRYIETWHYFSKGVSFSISSIGTITSVNLYATTWGGLINDNDEAEETIREDGVPYSYDIDGLGSFTDSEGITMDAIITKYGDPLSEEEGGKRPGAEEGETTQIYFYEGVVAVFFVSDDIDNYQGKKVTRINLL